MTAAIAEHRVGVAAQIALDVVLRGQAMHLGCAPPLGVFAKRDAARARVDILTGDDCGGHLIEPALRIGLSIEVLRVLLAGRVAVPCPPPPVGTLRDAGHYPPAFPIPSEGPR